MAVDPRYFRPAEVDNLLGDASRARAGLGWSPRIGFDGLVEMMVAADLEKAKKEAVLAPALAGGRGSDFQRGPEVGKRAHELRAVRNEGRDGSRTGGRPATSR